MTCRKVKQENGEQASRVVMGAFAGRGKTGEPGMSERICRGEGDKGARAVLCSSGAGAGGAAQAGVHAGASVGRCGGARCSVLVLGSTVTPGHGLARCHFSSTRTGSVAASAGQGGGRKQQGQSWGRARRAGQGATAAERGTGGSAGGGLFGCRALHHLVSQPSARRVGRRQAAGDDWMQPQGRCRGPRLHWSGCMCA